MSEEAKQVKFTKEELEKIQNIQSSYANITTRLGQLSVGRVRLEQQLESLDGEYDGLIKSFKEQQAEEQKFLDSITEKYGQGTLNPDTGEFTPEKSQ